jgi:hypothetical protein
VIPKKSLTGESTERVDTRVLQVIYSFQHADFKDVYVGQQVDVFISETQVENPQASAKNAGTPATLLPATTRDGDK